VSAFLNTRGTGVGENDNPGVITVQVSDPPDRRGRSSGQAWSPGR